MRKHTHNRQGISCCAIVLATVLSSCTSPQPVMPADPKPPVAPMPATAGPAPGIWDLTSDLTPQQRARNAEVYAQLDFDPCDRETEYDARVHGWVEDGSPEALAALHQFAYDSSHGRAGLAAAGRGYVTLARAALEQRDFATAARHSLNIYLSSTPHRVRLEALRVYCKSGEPNKIRRQIELIASGRQDARFRPLLPELRSSLAERMHQLRQGRE